MLATIDCANPTGNLHLKEHDFADAYDKFKSRNS